MHGFENILGEDESSLARMNLARKTIEEAIPLLGGMEDFKKLYPNSQRTSGFDDRYLSDVRTITIGLGRQSATRSLIREMADPDHDIVAIVSNDDKLAEQTNKLINQNRDDGKEVTVFSAEQIRTMFSSWEKDAARKIRRVFIIKNESHSVSEIRHLYFWLSEQDIDENIVIIRLVF